MKQVLLQWEYVADILNVPDYIADNLLEYQMEFDRWLSNKDNKHNYWVRVDPDGEGMVDALCFGCDAFIEYLNNFVVKDSEEQVYYALKGVQATEEQKKLPMIFF